MAVSLYCSEMLTFSHKILGVQLIYYLASPYNQRASLMARKVDNLAAKQENIVSLLDWEDPLEKGMATNFSIFAWRIPQRSLVGYSPWSLNQTELQVCMGTHSHTHTHTHTHIESR